MSPTLRINDPVLETAIKNYQRLMIEQGQADTSISMLIIDIIKERLVDGNNSKLDRLSDQMDELIGVLKEHTAAENILVYTLINGQTPPEGEK